MSDQVTYCASGCTDRGEHRAECDGRCSHRHRVQTCPPACDGTCQGCRPRLAEHGRLCGWCYGRLVADVHDAPALVAHLLETGRPFAQAAPPREVFTTGTTAQQSMRPAAWDTADELHALLASWVHLILVEHPAGLRGPDEQGSRRTRQTLSRPAPAAVRPEDLDYTYVRPSEIAGLADTQAPEVEWTERVAIASDGLGRPILDRDGQPIRYLVRAPKTPHRPEAPSPAAATARLCDWLAPHLEWAAGQEWAAEMRRELKEALGTARARWPQVDTRTRTIAGVACVRCGRLGLTYRPPNFPGASALITCSHPECGTIVSERDYEGALGRLAISRGYVA